MATADLSPFQTLGRFDVIVVVVFPVALAFKQQKTRRSLSLMFSVAFNSLVTRTIFTGS